VHSATLSHPFGKRTARGGSNHQRNMHRATHCVCFVYGLALLEPSSASYRRINFVKVGILPTGTTVITKNKATTLRAQRALRARGLRFCRRPCTSLPLFSCSCRFCWSPVHSTRALCQWMFHNVATPRTLTYDIVELNARMHS